MRPTLRLTGLYGRTETVLTTSPSYLPTIAPSANAAFGGRRAVRDPAICPGADRLLRAVRRGRGLRGRRGGVPQAPALAFPVRFRPVLLGGNPLFDNERQTSVLPRSSDMYQFTGELDVELGAVARSRRGRDLLRVRPLLRRRRQLRRPAAERARRVRRRELRLCHAAIARRDDRGAARRGRGHRRVPLLQPVLDRDRRATRSPAQANPNYAGTSNPLGLQPDAGRGADQRRLDGRRFLHR